MVTVQQIFDAAIDLMDEQNEQNGSTGTVDTREYQFRTISILNTAIYQLYPFSSGVDNAGPGRPCAPALLALSRSEPDFTQVLPLDDTLCWSLLPFYLASLLRAGEDTEFSMRMMTQYNNALMSVRDNLPASFEPISTPYGTF